MQPSIVLRKWIQKQRIIVEYMEFLDLVNQRYSCRSYQEKSYNREWFATAPMYIICSILHDEEWVRSDGKHHGDIDIAIAVEHLCLAATEQGLATCWVCNFDAEKCKQLFAIGNNEEPAVLIPIGYAADEPKEKKRKEMEEICK